MSEKKAIIFGVCASIAIYKICDLIRLFKKNCIDVIPIMTPDSKRFISPLLLESLSENRIYSDMFEASGTTFQHIMLSRTANLILIAPATANTIAKLASGLADNLLTSTVLASTLPVLIAPAMNVNMFENPITQENIRRLQSKKRFHFVMPESGRLACGDIGTGRLADIETIFDISMKLLTTDQLLNNKRVIVSAGPTREFLDPVRFLSNPSSGKMGYELARVAYWLGADVTLVSGPVNIRPPAGVRIVRVETAEDMKKAILNVKESYDMLLMAAAVSDWRFKNSFKSKIKRDKSISSVELLENSDILTLAKRSGRFNFILGFAAETDNIYENAVIKMKKKGIDAIFVNDVSKDDIGFGSDENSGRLILKDGSTMEVGRISKRALAFKIISHIINRSIREKSTR